MKEAIVDGARIAYAELGTGEPVVLLHGYPQNHRAWRHQFTPLAAQNRVIAPDWLGWGRSDRRLDQKCDLETEVTRLARLLDVLEVGRVTLVGHDYGGLLALGFAQRHPERVARLGVLNSRGHRTFPGIYYLATAMVGFLARRAWLRWILVVSPLYSIHRLGLRHMLPSDSENEELIESYVGWLRGPDKRWWVRLFSDYALAARPDFLDVARGLSCPAAIVWGTKDAWCPVTTANELAEAMPQARLVLLEGVDHFVMEERPAEVTRALSDLLSQP